MKNTNRYLDLKEYSDSCHGNSIYTGHKLKNPSNLNNGDLFVRSDGTLYICENHK